MPAYILDSAGFVTGVYDGPGQPAGSTTVAPPSNAAHPLRFVNGAWVLQSVPVADYRITRLSFLNRMTLQERVAIRGMAAGGELVVADFMDLLSAAAWIDLDRQDTKDGVEYLRVKGLLTSARSNAILNDPIQDAERPAA